MKKILKTHIRPTAIRFLLAVIVVFLAVDALSKFGIIDLTSYANLLLPVVSSMFIYIDVGVMSILLKKKKKKLDTVDWFSISIASIVLLSVLLGVFGLEYAFLTVAQGFASLFLGIFVIINIFKK